MSEIFLLCTRKSGRMETYITLLKYTVLYGIALHGLLSENIGMSGVRFFQARKLLYHIV